LNIACHYKPHPTNYDLKNKSGAGFVPLVETGSIDWRRILKKERSMVCPKNWTIIEIVERPKRGSAGPFLFSV
jgi:hypothetical protein